MRRSIAAVLVALGSSIVTGADTLHLRATVGRRVNAVYHVACLGESLSCSRKLFEERWARVGWNAADELVIDTWRQVMKAVSDGAPPQPAAPLLLNAPQFHPAQAARESVLVAAIEARTPAEFRRRTQPLLTGPQADRLSAAIDHVERRLAAFWPADAPPLGRRMQQVERAAKKVKLPETVSAMASFLEATIPNGEVYVDGIIPPDLRSESYTATQIGGHLLVELVDEAQPEPIASVALHELTHYLYNRAPRARHFALVDEFTRMDTAAATGLYTYLNEAIASAAQGVQAHRRGERDAGDKAYDHPYIAPLGAATVPLLDEALQRRGTLFSGFAARYAAAGAAALADKIEQPRFVLAQTAVMLAGDDDRQLARTYLSTMFPQVSAQFTDEALLNQYPELNVVRFARYAVLDAAGLPENRARLVEHKAFGYALRRGRRSWTCVLAGRDTAAIAEAIARLGTLPRLTSEGPLFTID